MSGMLRFEDLSIKERDDVGDDGRQRALHSAEAARSNSTLEAMQLPPESSSAEFDSRSRSAIAIQRAWRRPLAYFDSVLTASESANGSVGVESAASPLFGDVPDYAEAEAEALTAFDEALGMFEQSLGSTPRVR
jgi:hypothetical protein